MMKISEDKDFLMAQREEGRRGTMSGVDKVLFVKEKRADDKQKRMMERRRCMDNARAAASARVELESSTDSDSAEAESNNQKMETSKAVADASTSLRDF